MSKDINKNSMDNLFRGFTTSENIENMQEESSAVEVASSSVDSTPRKKRNSSKQPTGIRISTIVEVNLMDKVKTIAATDKERAAYYKAHTGREWIDARNYDLCLNSGSLGFDKCVQIISDYIKIKLG